MNKLVLILALGLVACSGGPEQAPDYGSVTLTWDAVEDEDVLGYHVYRSASADGKFERINREPLLEPTYVDYAAERGTTYYYRVTAVNFEGVESDFSEPAWKTVE